MKQMKSPNPSNSQKKTNNVLDKFAIPLSVTVLGGIIVGVILLFISPIINDRIIKPMLNNNTPTSSTAFFDSTLFCKAILNEVDFNNIIPDKDTLNEIISPKTDPDEFDYHSITSNGTMPKGTTPIVVPKTEEITVVLSSIQQLSIGCLKQWVDSKLGTPFLEKEIPISEKGRLSSDVDEGSKTGEILECIYIYKAFDNLNVILVQAYFDIPKNSCIAFFVTLLEDTMGIDIFMPEAYSSLVSNKPLGEFTYLEIGIPDYIYGYTGQGPARTFYGEKFYFMASGNYQDFYFANLDYGMLNSLPDFIQFVSIIQFDINPMGDVDGLPSSDLLIHQRSKFYPNTYGISSLNNQLTFDLLNNYYEFDSLALRGWT